MSAWALKDAEISCGKVFERAFGGEPQVVARCGVKVAQVFDVAEYPFSVVAVSGAVDILRASGNRGFLLLYR